MRPSARAVVCAVLAGVLAIAVASTDAAVAEPTDPGTGRPDLDALRDRREALEADLGAVTAELDGLAVRIADARDARARLREDVAELEARADDAREALTARAVAAYVGGTTGDAMDLLLDAVGPQAAIERSRVLQGLGTQERRLVEQARAARAALGQRRAQLDGVLAGLERDQRRADELQVELAAAFEATRSREVELASRLQRQRRISRSGQRGVYACPIARPFHFRDTWGAPRSGGRRHRGVDIFAPMGADVYAITDGAIARHSHSRLGGLGLYLAGDDGNHYYYAHLQEILPGYGPGRRVEAGELIARNGATGNATANAPHVHMEVRPGGGGNVNPYPFTASACF